MNPQIIGRQKITGSQTITGSTLFSPFNLGVLHLANRVVMAPMTRCFSPGGVPGEEMAGYYRRRVEGGTGLIITEGTHVPHPGAANDPSCPDFHGEQALAGWQRILDEVHQAGGKIMPQLWHVGLLVKAELENLYDEKGVLGPHHVGPSGFAGGMGQALVKARPEMTLAEIEAVIDAFGTAAETAFRMGFDGIEIHGAHGYLIDQFFWAETNHRTDDYGGSLRARARFCEEIVRHCRRRTAPDFPIFLRISQWKGQDYTARLAHDPAELEALIDPLTDAGVDVFDCSQRRFWEPEFPDSDLNLAGWVKRISGKATMTVGSVGLDRELIESLYGQVSAPASLKPLLDRLDRGDFDLVGVGRNLLVDPHWTDKIQRGALDELHAYTVDALALLA